MAAGNFTVFNVGKLHLLDGVHVITSHVYKMALCTQTQAIDATFAGVSTDCRYADLTAEVAGANGYTTGGFTLTMTEVRATGTITVSSSVNPSWASSTFSAKYGVIYDNTTANKNLLGFVDLETTVAAGLSPSNGTLTVTINASGLFTLA